MRILDKIGMCRAYKGYLYWEEAIMMAKRTRKDKNNISEIYRKIGEKYEETSVAIERNMTRTLERVKNLEKKLKVDYKLTTKKALMLLASKQKGEEDE